MRWVHFPLHPEIPAEGMALSDLFAGRDIDLEEAHDRMAALMREEGLPYRRRSHTFNTRLAQELAVWAERKPGGGAIHDRLFRAFFAEGKNVASTGVLLEVAESLGLDRREAATVLEDRVFREVVDRDWQESARLGVTGVPTFVAGRYSVVGAQPYEVLAQLIDGAKKSLEPR